MTDIDYRETIARICNHTHTRDGYSVDWEGLKEYEKAVFLNDAAEILRTVIAKGKVCCVNVDNLPERLRYCSKCNATGKLNVTIDDAVKGYIGYYSQEG